MFRLLNSFILLCAMLTVSCGNIEQFAKDINSYGFINLNPIGISIEPSAGSVLPEQYSPVIIRFNTEMEKKETEELLHINSDLGVIRGDKHWSGSDLYFVPTGGWTAGIRYNLSFTGTIRSIDRREIRIENYFSFYALNNNEPPLLLKHFPENCGSIKTNDVIMEFYFSCSMDKPSVESALTIEGITNKSYEWSDEDKILKVVPDKTLSPWSFYKWNLKDSAKSIDGVPLPKAYSASFITCLDQVLPQVTNVYPVLFSDGCWYPVSADIESGLDTGESIALDFNKPMNENALRSLRFEPSLSGRAEFLSEKAVVFIFSHDPEPETECTMIVSGDAKDSEGLKIGADFRINFKVNIPYLNIISIKINDKEIKYNFSAANNIISVTADQAAGRISLSLRFSLPFSVIDKQNIHQKIFLSPFFPGSVDSAALEFVNWISDDLLQMRWEGLSNGSGEIPHYYKITIPGGKSGIILEDGIYIKDGIILYLEAVK